MAQGCYNPESSASISLNAWQHPTNSFEEPQNTQTYGVLLGPLVLESNQHNARVDGFRFVTVPVGRLWSSWGLGFGILGFRV